MKRRTLLGLLAVPLVLPAVAPATAFADVPAAPLTPADQTALAKVQDYLNSIRTLKANFLQVAPDGSTSTGTAWIQRPGRMRFEYNPPSPVLLVAGGGLVVYHDSQLNQTSNIPIGETPLGILLRNDITLTGPVTVTAFSHPPGQIQITLVKTDSPGDGALTLVLADDPIALRQWSVTDSQRKTTTVTLYDVQLGGSFDQDMFYYANPSATQPRYSQPGTHG